MVFLLPSQVNTQRKAIVQLILEKRELLVGQRVKRDGTAHLSPQLGFYLKIEPFQSELLQNPDQKS